MSTFDIGVMPLVCVICEQPVGVINQSDLYSMIRTNDIYICKNCTWSLSETAIEEYLGNQPADYYVQLVARELVKLELEEVPA